MLSPLSSHVCVLRVVIIAIFVCGAVGFSAILKTQRQRPISSTTETFLFNEKGSSTIQKGEFIPIADDPEFELAHEAWESRPKHDAGLLITIAIPIITPVIAFLAYDTIASLFGQLIELLSYARAWVPVDGGAYQAKIITPAINGVVLPAIAVLFATLTSTTIVTLRARQVTVRQCLNTEAGELRAMEYLIAAYKDPEIQDNIRQYLIQYCSRIIAESQRDWSSSGIIDITRGMDSELYGVLINLTRLVETETPTLIVDVSMQAMTRLRIARQDRITALVSTYPMLHYWILGILAGGECTGFLMEANQELLVFLNAIQLKLLWSMLVSTFVACFTVFYDLLNPFYGGYQVSASVDQLYTIRLALKAESEMCLISEDRNECSPLDLEENANKNAVKTLGEVQKGKNGRKMNGKIRANSNKMKANGGDSKINGERGNGNKANTNADIARGNGNKISSDGGNTRIHGSKN